MRNLLSLSLVALAALGCSSETITTPSGSSSSSGSSSTSSGTSSSAASSSGAASSSSSSSSSGAMGPTTKIVLSDFDVMPGEEVYKCQNFANPFGGKDAEVTTFASHMTQGSHHLLLFYKPGIADGALEGCSGLEFAATPYSTQLPNDAVTFPEGVAALVPQTMGFRVQSHYLNTTDQPIHAHVEVDLTLATPGTITQHAGVFFVVEPNFAIPPQSTQVVKHDCVMPYAMNLVKAASHMHKHGTHFTSTIGGKDVFTTDTWNDPKPAFFDPAFAAAAGAPLHFECTFKNDGASTLTFGESAQTNEMCIFAAQFYPIADDQNPTVGCP